MEDGRYIYKSTLNGVLLSVSASVVLCIFRYYFVTNAIFQRVFIVSFIWCKVLKTK